MSAALLVLPDFLIIIFGWLLNRKAGYRSSPKTE
jgi:hypothetical protein